jgi:hypothetical protein
MPVILHMVFDKEGPFGQEMVPLGRERAESINHEPGFIWKIWTEDAELKRGGGVYLFETREHAQQYLAMHTQRVLQLGYRNIVSDILDVNLGLTHINQGPLKPNGIEEFSDLPQNEK